MFSCGRLDTPQQNAVGRARWRQQWYSIDTLPDLRNDQQKDWAADLQIRADCCMTRMRQARLKAAGRPVLRLIAGGHAA
jgi:hypothetical protein